MMGAFAEQLTRQDNSTVVPTFPFNSSNLALNGTPKKLKIPQNGDFDDTSNSKLPVNKTSCWYNVLLWLL